MRLANSTDWEACMISRFLAHKAVRVAAAVAPFATSLVLVAESHANFINNVKSDARLKKAIQRI